MSILVLILAAIVALGGFIGNLRGKKVDGGKHVGAYTLAGAGLAFAVAVGGFFLFLMLLFAVLPRC